MMKKALLPLVILLGLLMGCASSGDDTSADQDPGSTPTPTPTPTALSAAEATGGQQPPEAVTAVPEEDESGSNSEQPPESDDLTFVSVDMCDQVPKELVPCGQYDLRFTSDSMICAGTPISRQPGQDRDFVIFQPGQNGDGEYVDSPVQSVSSDGSLVLMSKVGEAAGSKSYQGSGTYPASGMDPERRIEWNFDYDTSAATIEGTLVAMFEVQELGQCTVTKDFEGSPG